MFAVFASDKEGLTFDDFLDLFSPFNPNASSEVKAITAFNLYGKVFLISDFDGDGFLNRTDVRSLLELISPYMKAKERGFVCEKV